MNSQQEREFFEQWGWEYNYVARKWVAPNGAEVTTDELMEFTDTEQGEAVLRQLVVMNGRRGGD